jgi:hypothetical protein
MNKTSRLVNASHIRPVLLIASFNRFCKLSKVLEITLSQLVETFLGPMVLPGMEVHRQVTGDSQSLWLGCRVFHIGGTGDCLGTGKSSTVTKKQLQNDFL